MAIRNALLRSFTLIELMIVMAVLIILATLAVPGYEHYIQRTTVLDAVSALGHYKIAIADFWSTQGRLPASGDTLSSTPADLPFGQTVTTNLPSYIQSIQLTNSGNGDVIFVQAQAGVFSTFSPTNTTVSLGFQPVGNEVFFACGNYTTNATDPKDIGFTDITILPTGCNFNGVQQWLTTTPTVNPD